MRQYPRPLLGLKHGPVLGHASSLIRARPVLVQKRFEGTRAELENPAGHITTAEASESLYFFDSKYVFPLRLQWTLLLPWRTGYEEKIESASTSGFDPTEIVKKALPNDSPFEITGVIPRLKDGGAFVRLSHPETVSSKEMEQKIRSYLTKTAVKPWWNPFARVHVHLVRGRPWVEDLFRPPSARLKVEFMPPAIGSEASELSQEILYSVFRPYGKLREIYTQPADSKVLPKYALLDFANTRRAIMAKNCLHGYTVKEENEARTALAKIRISYERKQKTNWIMDWLLNHPRIVIPIMAALVAAFTVAVFDPIRTFFIKIHITREYHLTDNKLYQWLRSRATNLLSFDRRRDDDIAMDAIWDDRKSNIEQIQSWLMETADTFIIVQGPRGSGKRELVVNQALKHVRNVLVVDCKPIQEARGDSATIDAAAQEVGYKPVFSWMNSISGMIDLAAQGATGIKTGFSETLDSQFTKVLTNTSTALKQVALESRAKDDKDAAMADDDWLEAHPERRPVVVIDNFLHKANESSVVYDKLAEWAASITTANAAHVIFLTTDVSFSKSLGRALPDRVFRQLSLGDCSPDVAKRFVISHLDSSDASSPAALLDGSTPPTLPPSALRADLAQLDTAILSLGGRLTDLEFLARRIKAGESPSSAVAEIIEQSASEILKIYLFSGDGAGARKWTPQQAWLLIKLLAKHEALRYNEVMLHDAFKTGGPADAVLQALEQAELITILASAGRPSAIRPGKPVFAPAFRRLVGDRVLSARLDVEGLAEQVKIEAAGIKGAEDELRLLGKLPKQPAELAERVGYLLKKVQVSQEKIERYEREAGEMKKVLQTQY